MVAKEKIDMIHNAISVGMSKEDAYLFAGLLPREINEVEEDEQNQRDFAQLSHRHEYILLNKLDTVVNIQEENGDHRAIVWELEHLFPRYSGKPINELPAIHIHTSTNDNPNVEIHTEEGL